MWQEWQELVRHVDSGLTVFDVVNDHIARGKLNEINKPLSNIKSFTLKSFLSLYWYKIKTNRERKRLRGVIKANQNKYVKPALLIEKTTGDIVSEHRMSRVNWFAYLYDYFVSVVYNWSIDDFMKLRWDSLEEFRLAADVRKSRDAQYWIDITHPTIEGAKRLSIVPRRKVSFTREQRVAMINAQLDALGK